MRTISLFLLPLALAPPLLFYLLPGDRSALLTDILALCFAHNAMAIIKIDSFQTGTILLSGLFLYDIWWVFGTDVVSRTKLWIVLNRNSTDFCSICNKFLDAPSSYIAGCTCQTTVAEIGVICYVKGVFTSRSWRRRRPRAFRVSRSSIWLQSIRQQRHLVSLETLFHSGTCGICRRISHDDVCDACIPDCSTSVIVP